MKNRTDKILVCTVDHFGKRTDTGFCIGYLKDGSCPDQLSRLHRAAYYMLVYCKTGTGTFISDDRSYMLEPPMVICVRPDTVFRLQIQSDEAEGIFFCMTREFINTGLNRQLLSRFAFPGDELPPYIRLTEDQSDFWNGLLEMMRHESDQFSSGNPVNLIMSYAGILLSEFDRSVKTGMRPQDQRILNSRTEAFTDLVNKHYKQYKLPSAYAGMLHISNNYLNKICKQNTGLTAGKLIRNRILAEAQRLLCHTSRNVNEIADELGFDSTSYFITFFKKMTGLPPDAFRRLS